MNTIFSVKKADVHLWRVYLPQFIEHSEHFLSVLSLDEIQRAKRFHFELHRKRFIITRYLLRNILSLYIESEPKKIEFFYGEHGKPYIQTNPYDIYFNLSHSHDMAVYGLTCHKEIGIDIEKIEFDDKMDVAKRFFNPEEYNYLLNLPKNKQNAEFYLIWARKEAAIKAVGSGLHMPLKNFSILKLPDRNTITFNDKKQTYHLLIEDISPQKGYQAAFAIAPPIANICYWEWTDKGPNIWTRTFK